MADLTADRITVYEAEDQAILDRGVANTGASWFKGALLAFNATGLIIRASDTTALRIAGEALETVTSATAGQVVNFRHGHIMALGYTGTWTGAALGLDACMLDDNLVTNSATAGQDIRVGRITRMSTELGTAVAHVHIARHGLAAFAGT